MSFAADQAGFGYADQISMLLKAAPYFIDYVFTLFQEGNPNNWYNDAANWLNQACGSANSNEYG